MPLGIPHSVFLDWEEEDQEKAMAWRDHQSPICQQCGTVPEDWMDARGRPLDPPPYEVVTRVCQGCRVLAEERDEFGKDDKPFIRLHLRRYRRKKE